MARVQPPPKRPGQQRGPRRIAGALLDIESAAAELGITARAYRARAQRGSLRRGVAGAAAGADVRAGAGIPARGRHRAAGRRVGLHAAGASHVQRILTRSRQAPSTRAID